MLAINSNFLFNDTKYLDWKYDNFKHPLKVSLLIYSIVHFIIGFIFLFNGITPFEVIKLCIVCASILFISIALKTDVLNMHVVYFLLSLIIDLITVSTMLCEITSGNGSSRFALTAATQLIGIALTSWFFPVVLIIPHVAILFCSSEIMRQIFNAPLCGDLYSMVLPIAIGSIGFNYMLDLKVQDMYRLNLRVAKDVVTDQLTGAYNRNILKDNIVKNDKMVLSGGIIMIDIDDFKAINDTYGHSDGDICLCELVGVLNMCIRGSDYLIRWGGEEFLIVCDEASKENLCDITNRITDTLQSFDLSHGFTISIGCTTFFDGERLENVISRADSLLYKAKASGKNTICI